MAFFRERRPEIEDSPEKEKAVMDYFRLCKPEAIESPERKKARKFADRLNSVRYSVEWLHSVL